MDRLVRGAWLKQELGGPDLRVLDCTCGVEMLPEGGFKKGAAGPAGSQTTSRAQHMSTCWRASRTLRCHSSSCFRHRPSSAMR
jgi:hypothetical protein